MKPYLCIEWNDTESEAVGWLVIHNFVNGYTGGGIRMHPAVTREEVLRLAECMACTYRPCTPPGAAPPPGSQPGACGTRRPSSR